MFFITVLMKKYLEKRLNSQITNELVYAGNLKDLIMIEI